MRFLSSVDEKKVFYTDLNGFQLTRRKTYSKLPMQGNFYPMPSMAVLQDANHRLTLCSRQLLGVASLKPGKGFNLSELLALFNVPGSK